MMVELDPILRGNKKDRKEFSYAVKIDTMINQDFCCNICHRGFTKRVRPHFDHIQGREDNSMSNCQALCPNCHNNKSVNENREDTKKRNENPSNIDINTKWI